VKVRGFTLLEMVVAISIFAVIAAISYAALNNFLDARARINDINAKIRELQSAFVLLEHDLRYAVNRPVRDQHGDPEPAFAATAGNTLAPNERLRLTTTRPSSSGAGAQQLTRVAWRLEDGALSRVTWRVLDRDIDSPEYSREVLSGVQDIEFRFLAYQANEELTEGDEWVSESGLPAGVEVTVMLEDASAYRRILEVGGGAGS